MEDLISPSPNYDAQHLILGITKYYNYSGNYMFSAHYFIVQVLFVLLDKVSWDHFVAM